MTLMANDITVRHHNPSTNTSDQYVAYRSHKAFSHLKSPLWPLWDKRMHISCSVHLALRLSSVSHPRWVPLLRYMNTMKKKSTQICHCPKLKVNGILTIATLLLLFQASVWYLQKREKVINRHRITPCCNASAYSFFSCSFLESFRERPYVLRMKLANNPTRDVT